MAEQKKKYPEIQAGETLLKVDNLCEYFGGLKAVDNVSFEVKKGEVFGLVGVPTFRRLTTIIRPLNVATSWLKR